MLTDAKVRSARPAEKPYKLYDSDGLFLFVPTSGSKLWRLKYRQDGKEKLAALGKYPSTTLSEARVKKDEFKRLLERGELPDKSKKAETFETITREWFSKKCEGWAESHSQKIILGLEKNVLPFIGKREIDSLEPVEILDLLRRIVNRHAIMTHLSQ